MAASDASALLAGLSLNPQHQGASVQHAHVQGARPAMGPPPGDQAGAALLRLLQGGGGLGLQTQQPPQQQQQQLGLLPGFPGGSLAPPATHPTHLPPLPFPQHLQQQQPQLHYSQQLQPYMQPQQPQPYTQPPQQQQHHSQPQQYQQQPHPLPHQPAPLGVPSLEPQPQPSPLGSLFGTSTSIWATDSSGARASSPRAGAGLAQNGTASLWGQSSIWAAPGPPGVSAPPPLPPLPLHPPPQQPSQPPQEQQQQHQPPGIRPYDPLAAFLQHAQQQQQPQDVRGPPLPQQFGGLPSHLLPQPRQPQQHHHHLPHHVGYHPPGVHGGPPQQSPAQAHPSQPPLPLYPPPGLPPGFPAQPPQQQVQSLLMQLEAAAAAAAVRQASPPLPPAQVPPAGQQRAEDQRAVAGGSSVAGRHALPQAPKVVCGPTGKPGGRGPHKVQEGRENRWVDHMDRRHHGQQPRAFFGHLPELDTSLRALADSLMPTEAERQQQMAAFGAVKATLLQRWPGARVHLFGSVANGLSVRHNNDIDVCLEIKLDGSEEEQQAAKSELAVAVGELAEGAGMAEVLALPKARVPVVKFVVPATSTKVDVTVNNLLACVNTKLLADYAAIDPRLAQLVALVKHWAKQRAVNDSYRGTLSSYCYVLMAIYHLQTRQPPVLPVLQALPATFRRQVGSWLCEFCDDVASLAGFGTANTETLAELLWSFFEYWAYRHDWAHGVLSIRAGGLLTKEDKGWTRRVGSERHLVSVEDPFEISHDLGRTVDRQTRQVLHKEFIRAATVLRDEEDPLDALFQPYAARSMPRA